MGNGRLSKDVIEERKVGFIGVIGRVHIRLERWRAADAAELGFEGWERVEVKPETDLPDEDVGSRIRQAEGILNVQICLKNRQFG